MEELNYKTPNNLLVRMQITHLGKILFNLQFAAVAVMFASVMSFVLTAVYYIMLIAVSVFTIFSIYAWYPEFASWWKGGDTLGKITLVLAESWKYTVPIVLVLSIASIVCLSMDKNKKHTARIAVSVLVAVVAAVVLVMKLINGGGA